MMRGAALTLVSAIALLAFVSDASGQAPAANAPPTPQNAQAPAVAGDADTVVSRIDNSQPVAASDLRLLLSKNGKEEHALIRRLIFITASLRLTEPAAWAGEGPAPQTCRFEYKSFLQRQQCFVSLSGVLACTQAEVTPLAEEVHGDAPAPANAQPGFCNDVFRPVANARVRLSGLLRDRAGELVAQDEAAKIDPVFKAAGLTVRPEPPPGPRPTPAAPPPAGK